MDNLYGEPNQRLIDPLYNFYLNYVYDFRITETLRDVMLASSYLQSIKSEQRANEFQKFNEACDSVINTYNHLHTQLFPKPLSDSEFHFEINKIQKIIKVERMRQ